MRMNRRVVTTSFLRENGPNRAKTSRVRKMITIRTPMRSVSRPLCRRLTSVRDLGPISACPCVAGLPFHFFLSPLLFFYYLWSGPCNSSSDLVVFPFLFSFPLFTTCFPFCFMIVLSSVMVAMVGWFGRAAGVVLCCVFVLFSIKIIDLLYQLLSTSSSPTVSLYHSLCHFFGHIVDTHVTG